MLATKSSATPDLVVALSITIVGVVLVVLLALVIFRNRVSRKYNSELKLIRSPMRDYFSFFKKNFLLFLLLFCVVLTISGLAMLITSLS